MLFLLGYGSIRYNVLVTWIGLNKQKIIAIFLACVACALLLSFILEDIMPHRHFGVGRTAEYTFQSAFHNGDKKWWLVLFAAFVFLIGETARKWLLVLSLKSRVSALCFSIRTDIAKLFDPMAEALGVGRMHPKLCD